ncbi:hypothetical protein HL667_01075 [Bradyrhizobium sp. 83012]|uniref:Restriction endonuclease type IV Mrr domain-containing protein n=1 Tax=Bradyrhizobium aeschynomenes TaxID=2734909 RepID=A0ABX2C7N4_9BRAD|nr:hypothetical protein [Bradyrhizobium aeschynomenes]NPU10098.1 hypothetical protein [Bradyrhizobium aeschynomenes]NPU63585.1 hypothetical protein [Bradyrhizobium aeschynomenes]NPV19412.1 hypothetical protein [Bradyrhizobium aeschynomenes]
MNEKEFCEGLLAWANDRGIAGLQLVTALDDGGYEAWLQADLAGYLKAKYKGQVAREQSVYRQESWRVDLLLNPELLTKYQILVEIKAQTAKQSAPTFMSEVEKDLKKLDEGRRNIYVNSGAFMLAVTIEKSADDGMAGWKPDDVNYIFNRVLSVGGIAFYLAFSDSEGEWRAAKEIDKSAIDKSAIGKTTMESMPKVGTPRVNQQLFGPGDSF